MSGTVVVGVDGSEASKAALAWATLQAEFLGATLVAVNSWGPIYPVGVDPEEKARQELTKVLVQVLGTDRAAAVRLVLSPDAPGHLLVQEAVDAEALVIGSHGHGHGHATLTGALLGSVS
jgi:nucleotide-binding universal stress UspA family protein